MDGILRPQVSPVPPASAAPDAPRRGAEAEEADMEAGQRPRRDVAAVVVPLPPKATAALHHHHHHHHDDLLPTSCGASPPPSLTAAAPTRGPLAPSSTIANPAPLGLLAFGVTTCLLCARTASWAEQAHLGLVVAFAFFLGGFGQVLAGIMDLLRGDAFGGTAFSLYGSFWLAWGLLNVLSIEKGPQIFSPPSAFKIGETLFLSLFALLTALLFVPTMRKSRGLMYVFASLAVTFALLAGGVWNAACNVAAGYAGLLCGSGAIVLAFCTLYKETLGWETFVTRPVRLL
jgi:uncharacterized protein